MLARATDTWACAWLSSAFCSTSSSCTSNWPLRTRAPSANAICTTRPATSGRSITLWRDLSVPTACASSCKLVTATLATSTPGARGAPPGPAAPTGPAPPGPAEPGPGAPAALPAPAAPAAPDSAPGVAAVALPAPAAPRCCTHQAPPVASARPRAATAQTVCFFVMLSEGGREKWVVLYRGCAWSSKAWDGVMVSVWRCAPDFQRVRYCPAIG